MITIIIAAIYTFVALCIYKASKGNDDFEKLPTVEKIAASLLWPILIPIVLIRYCLGFDD